MPGDRKKLDEELNRIKGLFQETDSKMKKLPGSEGDRTKLRELMNKKRTELMAEYGDDLQKLNAGGAVKVAGTAGKEAAEAGGSKLMKTLGKKALGMAIPGLGVAGSIYDALDSEALANSTDMGLEPEEEVNVQAMRDLQETGELTPDRFSRVRQMVNSGKREIDSPMRAPSSETLPVEHLTMDPARANALTGVDLGQEARDQQLDSELEGIEELDPQAQRNLKLRKLFQGQIK